MTAISWFISNLLDSCYDTTLALNKQTNNKKPHKETQRKKKKKATLFCDSRHAEKCNTTPLKYLCSLAYNAYFPHLTRHTQDTVAFGAQAFSPSASLLDPSSKPTRLGGDRILKGWPATTPQQGCWSHEEAV